MDVSSLVEIKQNPKIPIIAPGDTVRVSAKIIEGGKERIQVFQGVVIKMRHSNSSASFTVRHVAYGIGVERTFLLYSPLVEKVEIVRHGKVRRSKLYYLRSLSGKEARRKIKRVERKAKEISEELLETETEDVLNPEEVVQEQVEIVTKEEAVIERVPVDEETKEPDLVAKEEIKLEESINELEATDDSGATQENIKDEEKLEDQEYVEEEMTSETEVKSVVEEDK